MALIAGVAISQPGHAGGFSPACALMMAGKIDEAPADDRGPLLEALAKARSESSSSNALIRLRMLSTFFTDPVTGAALLAKVSPEDVRVFSEAAEIKKPGLLGSLLRQLLGSEAETEQPAISGLALESFIQDQFSTLFKNAVRAAAIVDIEGMPLHAIQNENSEDLKDSLTQFFTREESAAAHLRLMNYAGRLERLLDSDGVHEALRRFRVSKAETQLNLELATLLKAEFKNNSAEESEWLALLLKTRMN